MKTTIYALENNNYSKVGTISKEVKKFKSLLQNNNIQFTESTQNKEIKVKLDTFKTLNLITDSLDCKDNIYFRQIRVYLNSMSKSALGLIVTCYDTVFKWDNSKEINEAITELSKVIFFFDMDTTKKDETIELLMSAISTYGKKDEYKNKVNRKYTKLIKNFNSSTTKED